MAVFRYPSTSISTTGLATETKQDDQITLLTSLDGKDYSTETTLSALNAKVTAVDTTGKATEAKQDSAIALLTTIDADTSTIAAVDFATETTLSALNAKHTTHDLDTGAGTENNIGVNLRFSASGGSVEAGTSSDPIRVDTTGTTTQPVSASSLPLPTGAATEATLNSIDGKDFATQTTLAALNTKVTAVDTTGKATEAKQDSSIALLTTIDADTGSISTNTATIAGAVSGTEMQVDVITSALPTGAATEAKQDTGNTSLSNIDTNTARLDIVDFLDSTLVDTSSSNIPGSAGSPLQVVASTAADVTKIQIVEDIGEYYGIYTGAAASEVLVAVVPLGGGEVEVQIPSGTRISLLSLTTSAISVGSVAMNFLG